MRTRTGRRRGSLHYRCLSCFSRHYDRLPTQADYIARTFMGIRPGYTASIHGFDCPQKNGRRFQGYA